MNIFFLCIFTVAFHAYFGKVKKMCPVESRVKRKAKVKT